MADWSVPIPDDYSPDSATLIKGFRRWAKLGQRQLADMLGLKSRRTVYRLEHGWQPDPALLRKIVEVMREAGRSGQADRLQQLVFPDCNYRKLVERVRILESQVNYLMSVVSKEGIVKVQGELEKLRCLPGDMKCPI